MKNQLILLIFSGFFISCSTTSYISPKEDLPNDVGKFYAEGKEIGMSVEDSTIVAFFGQRENKELTVHIFYKNNSNGYINIFPESLKVYGVQENGYLKQLHTYNPQKYLKRMRNRQNLALALSAMGKAFADADAGTSTTNDYGTVNSSDGDTYNYYGTSTTTDESEKRAAQRENQEEIHREAKQAELYRNSVKSGLLMKTTLFPGSYIEGNVIVKYKSFDKYLLEVPIGEETHMIYFELIKI